jgi:hypothetical protein
MLMERVPPTLELLDALSRTRSLTPLETLRLERAVRRTSDRHERWHWTRADDYRLIRHLIRGRKPAMMDRTERAVWRRLSRLGINVRRFEAVRPAKSSIANDGAKGEGNGHG